MEDQKTAAEIPKPAAAGTKPETKAMTYTADEFAASKTFRNDALLVRAIVGNGEMTIEELKAALGKYTKGRVDQR